MENEPENTSKIPEITEPEITEPEITEPEITEPEITEPEIVGTAPEPEPTPENHEIRIDRSEIIPEIIPEDIPEIIPEDIPEDIPVIIPASFSRQNSNANTEQGPDPKIIEKILEATGLRKRYFIPVVAGAVAILSFGVYAYLKFNNNRIAKREIRLEFEAESARIEKDNALKAAEQAEALLEVTNARLRANTETLLRVEKERRIIEKEQEVAAGRIKKLERNLETKNFSKETSITIGFGSEAFTKSKTVTDIEKVNYLVNCYIADISTGKPCNIEEN